MQTKVENRLISYETAFNAALGTWGRNLPVFAARSVKTEAELPETTQADVKTGFLYFIRAGEFVKIGRTTNIDQRIASLQTGCPLNIEAAFYFPNMGKLERTIHADLFHERVRGEWFVWGDAAERQLNLMRRRAFECAAALAYLHERARNKPRPRVQIPYTAAAQ